MMGSSLLGRGKEVKAMLADLLHKVAAMEQEEETPYAIRPSLASPETAEDPGRCKRALTYWRRGEPPAPWPGRFLLVLDDAAWHEELTADWIHKTAYRLHSQQMPVDIPLPKPLGTERFCGQCKQMIPPTLMHGHIDGILTDLLGVDRLYEHKAVNHFGFQEYLKGHLPLDYLAQGCLYVKGVKVVDPDLQEGLLLIKNKNTAAYLEYRFTYEPEGDLCQVIELVGSDGTRRDLHVPLPGLVGAALKKFEEVEAHHAAGTLPSRPYPRDSWQCGYCRFAQTCWAGAEAEYRALAEATVLPPEAEALLRAYWEAGQLKKNGEQVQEVLRPKILALLQQIGARSGRVGGFHVTWSLQTRTSLDPTLVPPEVRQRAEVAKTVEILRVTRREKDGAI